MMKDLTREQQSYIYGLITTDGYITHKGENGKYWIGIELQEKDKNILEKLFELLPEGHIYSRVRDTNFKENYACSSFRLTNQEDVQWFIDAGLPLENKTELCAPPNFDYDEDAFWRGVIDGDGSLGLRHTKQYLYPYISLTTKSDPLKLAYHDYVLRNIGFNEKNHRNKRDNIYNITICNKRAMALLEHLYKNATIYLDRKYNSYLDLLKWKEEKDNESNNSNR